MDVHIDVQHANVAVLKNKSASMDIVYKNHFPASAEFLKESRNVVKKYFSLNIYRGGLRALPFFQL